jgi:hypothetical protein
LDREVFDTLLEANVLRRRVMAVVAPLSSRNISRDGSIAANSSHQATRSVFISGRFFSAARSDFFCAWDGNEDAASIDAGHRNWYQLTLCQERRESHQEALYTTS